MRSLRQPGPEHPTRIDCFHGEARQIHITLRAGTTLNDAITAPLVAAGFQAATVTIAGAALNPLRYVMPGPPDNASHVAYFTAPAAPAGTCHLIQANATFGWNAGKPSVHCHAAWTEPDGQTRGGHILPLETTVAEPAEAVAWGFRDPRIETAPDRETNFTLFQPSGVSRPGNARLARVKPNQDILTAIETVAPPEAVIRGSLGSLIGASFTDGRVLDDIATEVLVRQGHVRGGRAELELLAVDMKGDVHQGWLKRGENPVCITFDLVIT